jgi:hypothetical protein
MQKYTISFMPYKKHYVNWKVNLTMSL